MQNVYYLDQLTYEEVEKLDKDKTIIFLPIGPLEAHGPHLPLGVDINGSMELCKMGAKRLADKGIPIAIAPVMPYTLSDAAMPFAGTVTLSKDTVISFVLDVSRSFASHGFKKMIIVCHHLERPNLIALQKAAERAKSFNINILVSNAIINSFPKCGPYMKGAFPEMDFHAGEAETAFYLWKYPELVKKDILVNLRPVWSNIRQKFKEGAKDFVEAGGPKCYFGDPSKATAESGKNIFIEFSKTLADEVHDWDKSN